MTLPGAFRGGGLADLTALNRRIIAQVDQGTLAEEAAEEALFGTEEGVSDPDLVEEETPEVRGRFSTENPLEHHRVREWIEMNVFGGQTTGMTPLITAFVNEWDVEYRRRLGFGPEEQIGAGATLDTLLMDDDFINGALWMPLTATNQVPPTFESAFTDPETGEEQAVVGVANPLTGVEFITIEPDLAELKRRPQTMFEVARRGRDFIRRALAPTEGEPRPQPTTMDRDVPGESAADRAAARRAQGLTPVENRPQFPDYMRSLILYSDPASEGRVTGDPRQPGFVQPGPLPRITQNELVDALSDRLSSGGGGGGGGGAARRDITFDRDHLIAQLEERYNRWMLDPNPAPVDLISGIVDSYTREARAFWSGAGGQLDFDTYATEKLRGLPRYQQVYKYKVPSQSEEQFLASFSQPIEQMGQSGEFTRSQSFAAVTSGGSPVEQTKRVSRTREVEQSGGFSQRLAQTLAGIGVG